MTLQISRIRRRAEQIAAAAAETLDADALAQPLGDIARLLADNLTVDTPLDTTPLRELNISDTRIARLLRALQAEAIETLRQTGEEEDFQETVLAVRRSIKTTISALGGVRPSARIWPGDHALERPPTEEVEFLGLLQAVMSTIQDVVFVHDTAGDILYMNPEGLRLTGFTDEDLRDGLSLYDLVLPGNLDLIEARLESPGADIQAPFTLSLCTKDGARFPAEISTSAIIRDGRVHAFVAVARDLRLVRRLERELQRANARADHLAADAPHGILLTDARGAVREMNPPAARLLGCAASGGMLGQPLSAVCPEAHAVIGKALADIRDTKTKVQTRVTATTSFGAALDADMFFIPLPGGGAAVESILILIVEPAPQQPEAASSGDPDRLSALRDVIAGIGHELNNPLTGIMGYAQLLHAGDMPDDAKERLDRITLEADRCRRIVDNLLGFARQSEAEKSPHDINKMLRDTLALQDYQLRTDGIEVSTDLAADLPPVAVAQQEIQRVFLNILTNAQQALNRVDDRPRELTVSTKNDSGAVHIRFADNGPGLSSQNQARVFDPFFTTHDIGAGTGLGLSVSYGIVHNHGGKILIDSEEGQGAAFTVVLPLLDG